MLEIVLLCAGCHGMNGEGRPEAGYPRLAAQPQSYLERQLVAYADGRRPSMVMTPLAKRLSPEERRQAAAHFAQRTTSESAKPQRYPARGETLAVVGDNALRVQACQNCHGPQGRGLPPYGPYLAGLHSAYLESEMRAWKTGERTSDPSGSMRVIAHNLGEADIAAVSAYYAALPPPPPLRGEPLQAARRITGPTAGGGGGNAEAGSGVGGGASTTGGSQGAGGSPPR